MAMKPRVVNRVPDGQHVYISEWGDGSPCVECMQSKEAHRYVKELRIIDLHPQTKDFRRKRPNANQNSNDPPVPPDRHGDRGVGSVAATLRDARVSVVRQTYTHFGADVQTYQDTHGRGVPDQDTHTQTSDGHTVSDQDAYDGPHTRTVVYATGNGDTNIISHVHTRVNPYDLPPIYRCSWSDRRPDGTAYIFSTDDFST